MRSLLRELRDGLRGVATEVLALASITVVAIVAAALALAVN